MRTTIKDFSAQSGVDAQVCYGFIKFLESIGLAKSDGTVEGEKGKRGKRATLFEVPEAEVVASALVERGLVGPTTVKELAERTKSDPQVAYEFLRFMSEVGGATNIGTAPAEAGKRGKRATVFQLGKADPLPASPAPVEPVAEVPAPVAEVAPTADAATALPPL